MFRGGSPASGAAAITSGTISGATITGGTVSGTTITGTNVPYALSESGIPFIHASTGSMGNNGAITAMTALPRTYSDGAWIWLPAGAVAAGVPAAASWLWFVGSSTTAGTVFNSTYASGPVTLGVQTAYATTGPGAFTGDTTEAAGPTITVPAGAIGPNGQLLIDTDFTFNNTAGIKTLRGRLGGIGGTAHISNAVSTQVSGNAQARIANKGAANRQLSGVMSYFNSGVLTQSNGASSTVDTSASTTVVFSLQKAVATDHLIVERWYMGIAYGA